MRTITNMNENWHFIKNATTLQQATQQTGQKISLPHTWNAVDGQDGGNDYYRGACWYIKEFSKPIYPTNGKVYLEFLGAAHTAVVYFNEQEVSCHKGGYSTFRVDITDYLQEENRLAVCVSNEENDTIYPQKADFTFYGGLYRSVNLIVVPESHFCLDYYGSSSIKVTPVVSLDTHIATVTVETWVSGQANNVQITVNNEQQDVRVINGYAQTVFCIENVHLWNGVYDPYLYTATANLESGDTVSTKFGCREFYIDPQKGFFLNGVSYPLRGVSRHQDCKGAGNALTLEMHKADMQIMKEIGANTVRLAHYQHAQEFYDLCDENGIVVWAEIPYITMHMNNGTENTLSQMRELVVQNYNHASVAVWGLSNEITAASPVNETLLENHRQLNDLCHKLDATRKTTMANVFMLEIDSPILDIPDVNSYNLYFGWYIGELEQNDEFFDEFHAKYPNRAIGFSEYGADANPAYHSTSPEKGDYTESYQAIYHEHMLALIEARPWMWATHVWSLFDFAADGRDEGGKHGENQKGLVTMDRKLKKDAFYLYKAAWNKTDAFVHLCGRRYIERTEEITEVKVYSNQPEVSLYIDGFLFATQCGKTIFKFNVPITGKHTVQAKANNCEDTITIHKVSQANESYVFVKKQDIVNWFDQDDFNPDCFSVSDTLAELRANPNAAPVIEQMMAQGAASRGDVADAVKDNPALQRMMGRMTLISLLKQASTDESTIKQINRVLQGIKK